jgi:hypothetical protein
MRLTMIYSWVPENARDVYERFNAFGAGRAPKDVMEAYSKLAVVAWEKLSNNEVVLIVEGDEFDVATWNGYWQDVGDFDLVTPSYDLTDSSVVEKIATPAFMGL